MDWEFTPLAFPPATQAQQDIFSHNPPNVQDEIVQWPLPEGHLWNLLLHDDYNVTIDSISVTQDGSELPAILKTFEESLSSIPSPMLTLTPTRELAYRSQRPDTVTLAKPKYPTRIQWLSIKAVFIQLYITEDMPLKEVRDLLERDHGFSTT